MLSANSNVKDLNKRGGSITKALKSSKSEAEFLQKSLKNVDNVTDDLKLSLKQTYQEYLKLVMKNTDPLPKEIQDVDVSKYLFVVLFIIPCSTAVIILFKLFSVEVYSFIKLFS